MNGQEPAIRAVAFDIDGTLYPNFPMYVVSIPVVVRNMRLFRAFGRARKIVRNERPLADLFGRTAQIVAEELGRDVDDVSAEITRVIYDQWESLLRRVSLYDGAEDLVRKVRQRGVPTAAMSDFPVRRKLELLGIVDLWDVAFSSEETGYLKPNPEPFQRLIDELRLPPEEILYVGNSLHYDIFGARNLGLRTAHITGRRSSSAADFSFRRYAELWEWLEPRLPESQDNRRGDGPIV